MAAVDSFNLLYRQIAQSCHSHVEFLAMVGALYTTRKGLQILCGCYNLIRQHVTPQLLGGTDLVKKYGEWAVVTGAAAGVGKAYAEELARRGVNIALISDGRDNLRRVSDVIAATYRVRTIYIEVDFSHGRKVYPTIRGALGDLDVGILVNSVAPPCDHTQYFMETSEDQLWDLINSNIAAATMMVHIVLPGMVERKRGAIVNVSSGSCCKRNRKLAVLSASKVYLERLTQELVQELSPQGVFVQSLTPLCVGPTQSDCCTLIHRLPFLVPTPEVFAHHAVRMLGNSSRTTGYWGHSLQLLLSRCFPGWIFRSLAPFV
ncbi:inactive hydroxysteroid dehydrogenase-like protein 1 isoform 1-T2 [Discoglossus pictus]